MTSLLSLLVYATCFILILLFLTDMFWSYFRYVAQHVISKGIGSMSSPSLLASHGPMMRCGLLDISVYGTQPVRTVKYTQNWYRPNVAKRKKKHGFAARCRNRRGLIVMWRRFLKGKDLSK